MRTGFSCQERTRRAWAGTGRRSGAFWRHHPTLLFSYRNTTLRTWENRTSHPSCLCLVGSWRAGLCAGFTIPPRLPWFDTMLYSSINTAYGTIIGWLALTTSTLPAFTTGVAMVAVAYIVSSQPWRSLNAHSLTAVFACYLRQVDSTALPAIADARAAPALTRSSGVSSAARPSAARTDEHRA